GVGEGGLAVRVEAENPVAGLIADDAAAAGAEEGAFAEEFAARRGGGCRGRGDARVGVAVGGAFEGFDDAVDLGVGILVARVGFALAGGGLLSLLMREAPRGGPAQGRGGGGGGEASGGDQAGEPGDTAAAGGSAVGCAREGSGSGARLV